MPKNSTSPKQNDSRCKPKKKRICLNCVIQKLEDPKNNWKFVRPQNIAKVLRNPKQQLKHQPTLKNRIWPNFNPPKKGQDSCLNFEICSLGVEPVLLAVLLSCWQCSSGESRVFLFHSQYSCVLFHSQHSSFNSQYLPVYSQYFSVRSSVHLQYSQYAPWPFYN